MPKDHPGWGGQRPGAGRPPMARVPIALLPGDDLLERLEEEAARRGMTVAQWVRAVLIMALSRGGRR